MSNSFDSKIFFRTASEWTKKRFGKRVQKIPIDGGFSCPNRDGKLSTKGCLYCNNRAFSPFYTGNDKTISQQISTGIDFFSKRYNCNSFFAYFQAYSGTYASIETLKERYKEALRFPEIKGLIIATRPDCINKEVVELLEDFNKKTYVRVELGIESFNEKTLKAINRCHGFKEAINSINLLGKAKIEICVHLIFGLPMESTEAPITYAKILSETKTGFVKLHHLQIVEGSQLALIYEEAKIDLILHSLDSYIEKVSTFLAYLRPDIYIERFINRVPKELLIAPNFGNINENQFMEKLCTQMGRKNLKQGVFFTQKPPNF